MNQKNKGLLGFALGGVILTYVLMNLLDTQIILQGNDLIVFRLHIMLFAFFGFIFLGYGIMQIIKQERPSTQ
jgi:hypothetical protein